LNTAGQPVMEGWMGDITQAVRHLMARQAAIEALRPFVDAYQKAADPIGDSDLYDEQPRHVAVTLGDCRRAARALADMHSTAALATEA
jgi:hypothetical protein